MKIHFDKEIKCQKLVVAFQNLIKSQVSQWKVSIQSVDDCEKEMSKN